MRPTGLFLRVYLLRGVRLWVVTRLVVSGPMAIARMDPLDLTASGVFQIVAITVGVCFVDVHRRREGALIGNLAVHPVTLVALFGAPALVGEVLLRAAAAALR